MKTIIFVVVLLNCFYSHANPCDRYDNPLQKQVYLVGRSRAYTSVQSLLSKVSLKPGDTVKVDAGIYTGSGQNGILFDDEGTLQSPIVICRNPQSASKPILQGGDDIVKFAANHYVFEGFEIVGNATTKRGVFTQAHNITIQNTIIRDVTDGQGLLAADNFSGSLTLEYVEIYNCGMGIYKHSIYAQTDEISYPGSVFTMKHCYLHHQHGGNGVKVRAERAKIYYNWIEGGFNRELELIGPDPYTQLPDFSEDLLREDADVVGNVFIHTTDNQFDIVRAGGDRTGQSKGMVRFVNNTFILAGGSRVFNLFDSLLSIEMHNNIFYKTDGGKFVVIDETDVDWKHGRQVVGSYNWMPSNIEVPVGFSNSITSKDPSFVDAKNLNFHLKPISSAIDAGTGANTVYWYPFAMLKAPIYEPPHHQLGFRESAGRAIAGNAVDVGAFEYYPAKTCAYVISPVSRSHTSAGGEGTAKVFTESGCVVKAITNVNWITIVFYDAVTGSLKYTVSPNKEPSRQGTISIGGQTFMVNQEGDH